MIDINRLKAQYIIDSGYDCSNLFYAHGISDVVKASIINSYPDFRQFDNYRHYESKLISIHGDIMIVSAKVVIYTEDDAYNTAQVGIVKTYNTSTLSDMTMPEDFLAYIEKAILDESIGQLPENNNTKKEVRL